MSSVLELSLTLFLVADAIGTVPPVVSLLKDFDFKKQQAILFRETIFSFFIAVFFLFVGEAFLQALSIERYALGLCGGILLMLVSLNMIFPLPPTQTAGQMRQEPFIVPIATPLISGPGLLAIIMLISGQEQNNLKVFSALVIAWIGVGIVLLSAPYLQRLMGRRGLIALEQLMGMLLAILAMDMIVSGTTSYLMATKLP